MVDGNDHVSPFARALLAGAVAGTTVDISLYPLDTLKTRLQSSQGFARAGGFRGIYAGVGSALVGSAPGAALFFVSYEGVKKACSSLQSGSVERTHSGSTAQKNPATVQWTEPFVHMAAASVGEVAACAVRVPTEVVKQRAQAMQAKGSFDALRGILGHRQRIGLAGVWKELYRGWTITIMREVPFTVIQFPIWESLKQWRRHSTGAETTSALESGLFGSLAGAVAAGLTTPLDVLKTRLMLAKDKERAFALAGRIFREDGMKTFVSGMGPRTIWISIGGAVFLGSYQYAYNKLEGY